MKPLDILPNELLVVVGLVILPMIFFIWGMLTIRNNIFPFKLINFLFREDRNAKMIVAKAKSFDLFVIHADVVFIGDSITEAGQWHDMFPTVDVANRGIAGDTTEGILARMDGILATAPKKALIMVGFNDLNGGNKVSQVFSRYCAIVRKLEEAQTTVVIQSTIDCSARLRRVRSKIRRLNEKLESFAVANGHLWIDLNERLASSQSGLNPAYTYDGVHLNGDGYRQWRDVITDTVLDCREREEGRCLSALDDRGSTLPGHSSPLGAEATTMADAGGHACHRKGYAQG